MEELTKERYANDVGSAKLIGSAKDVALREIREAPGTVRNVRAHKYDGRIGVIEAFEFHRLGGRWACDGKVVENYDTKRLRVQLLTRTKSATTGRPVR